MAIWYAQLAGTDVSAANQWNAAPDGSGAWLTWANLQPTDVLCANGKMNLYVASGFTCGSITTSGGGIGADGGWFSVQGGAQTFTLTCDVVAGTSYCLRIDHSSGTVAVIGDVTAGGLGNAYGIHKYTGAGTLTVEGAILGGSSLGCRGLFVQAANSTTVVTGSATGGTGASSHGICVTGAGATVTLYGNVTGGSATNAHGAFATGAGAAITITGNVTGGSAASAMGAQAFDGGTITITGTVTGGSAWATYGAMGNGETTLVTVIGSIINNTYGPGVSGIYYWRPASVAHYWQVAWNGSYNFRYTLPPMAQNVREGVQRGYMLEIPDNGTLRIPAEADVKLGVGYGGGGTEYTGTLVAGGGGVPLIGPGGLVG